MPAVRVHSTFVSCGSVAVGIHTLRVLYMLVYIIIHHKCFMFTPCIDLPVEIHKINPYMGCTKK
jgi:hypothetical protein